MLVLIQAKQRNYSCLTPEMINDYFRKVMNGDINDIEVRKHITRLFIREVVLYENRIVIIFNFTDKSFTKKTLPDKIEDIELGTKNSLK